MVGTANLQSLFPTLSANFPQRTPVEWTNNETQLSAANLNTLTTNIVYNRTTLGSVISSVNTALTTISNRNAGWRALDGSGGYALGEIFNDYVNNKATAPLSHAEGEGTVAYDNAQHVQGRWNEKPTYDGSGRLTNPYAHIIGGGSSDSNRFNIHTVDWDGNAWYKGDVQANIKRDDNDYVASFTDIYSVCDRIIGTEEGSKAGEDSLWGIKRYVDELDRKTNNYLKTLVEADSDAQINRLNEIIEWLNNEENGAAKNISTLMEEVPQLDARIKALEQIAHAVLSGTGTPDNNKGNNGDVYIKLAKED